ncbi:MAG: hypothetical protein ABIJ40_11545 [Bacteroidota bacterium]
MKKHNIISIAVLLLVYFIINLGWSHFQKEVGYKGGKNQASDSIKESKKRGCFVEELTIVPKTIEVKGGKIQIKEVWIEKRHDLSFIISLLPTVLEYPIFNNKKKLQMSFNFIQNEIPDVFDDWFFIVEGKGSSFTNHGNVFLTAEIDRSEWKDWKNIKIFLTNYRGFENAKTFLIKKF